MGRYLIRRIASLVPVLLIMSFIVFMLIHLIPGDPAKVILGDEATPAAVEALRQQMGLNDPLLLQYVHWMGNVLTGHLGQSVFMKGTMGSIIFSHIIPTLQLTVYAMIIAFCLSLPLGMLAAAKRKTAADQAISSMAMLGISIPSFLLSLFLILLFAVKLGWLPPAGYKEISRFGLLENIRYMILPAAAMGMVEAGLLIRMTRSSLMDVMEADYIRMARAKGVSEFRIVTGHALKNAALPILTAMGQTFVAVLSGAAVAETIFNIPGVGQLIVNSVSRRDYEVIQSIILVIAVINVMTYLAVDILYRLIDPRIRLDK
jgi:peptide/nickel transport system permease protein